jgi:hypothetical protein
LAQQELDTSVHVSHSQACGLSLHDAQNGFLDLPEATPAVRL